MNIQEQESGLTSLLLESISVMKQNRISNKDTRLFESNFKALYKDVNGLSSLNESRIPFTKDENKPNVVLNKPTNVFAYLHKVVDICESYDETFVMNLNESFKVEGSEVKDKYDIPSYIKYLKRVINTLLNTFVVFSLSRRESLRRTRTAKVLFPLYISVPICGIRAASCLRKGI